MRTYDKTSNGIEYTDELAGIDGASFMLYPVAAQSADMVKAAVSELFNSRDVVSMKIADEWDWDERYRAEIFAHPLAGPLRWYEINADDYGLIRRERKKGTTAEEYVKRYVLPLAAEIKAANLSRYGGQITEI